MSTRSCTFIKNGANVTRLYKHHDGYPSGTLPSISTIISLSKKFRNEAEIVELTNDLDGVRFELEFKKKITLDKAFVTSDHGDLEWLYVLDLEARTLAVYTVSSGRDVVNGASPIDPMSYVERMRDDYKKDMAFKISRLLERLEEQGIKVLMPDTTNVIQLKA